MVVSRWDFAAAALVLMLTPLVLVQPLVLAVAALPLVVALVAAYPTAALTVAVPVAMLPGEHRVGGVPIAVPVLAALELGLAVRGVKDRSYRGRGRFLLAAVGLGVLLAASYLTAPQTTTGSGRNHLLLVLLAFGLTVTVVLTRPPLRTMLLVLATTGTVLCGWALVSGSGQRLVTTDLANPNAVGYVAATTALLLLALRGRWLLAAPIPVVALVRTESRGALISLVVGLVVLALVGKRRQVQVVIGVGLVAAGVLFWPHATGATTLGRDTAQVQLSTSTRSQLAHLAVNLTEQHPLMGVGYRRFPDYSARVTGLPYDAHDEYLRTAAESGIPAFLLLLALAFGAVRLPGRAKAPLVGGLAGFAFANTFSLLTVSLPVFLLLGLAWSGTRVDGVVQRVRR